MMRLSLSVLAGLAGLSMAQSVNAQPYPPGYYSPAFPPGYYRPAPYPYRTYRVLPPEEDDGFLSPPGVYDPPRPDRYRAAPRPERGVEQRAPASPGLDQSATTRDPYVIPYEDFDSRSPGRNRAVRDGNEVFRPPAALGSSRNPGNDVTGSIRQPHSGQTYAALPPDDQPEDNPAEVPAHLRRQVVPFASKEPAGTILIDTPNTYLYYVLGDGQAVRYGIGVGRDGFTWSGREKITRMAEWPDWHPPKDMIERQPYLPRFMAGGPQNPLGARALYLGNTLYRIHGTNQPSTIGKFVSSGCIRMLNEDVEDLYGRVQVGTRVVVIDGKAGRSAAAEPRAGAATPR